ncbi:MAG: LPS export ABC transporter ATP-binding protein [Gammaproteobacteria bacterium]|jgi:lipopolysaccharide export system ATP-binding protein|nr:LPS export ABC transporter ATP-binding protein [Gammaproteobacteria bacterium]MBT3694356.1 LPS export ABC transporter ATP-binding protein [Gammaproteobacteria bacterium]MBT5332621.1 LPS export ABC transporter ATP-binding protein [Gammaproteobacteria bacterium]MBT5683256.1 LPS export ABC transporter ATP-binding protein [Gammaproteobacteria bacterium]MBT6024071.1 LPS export ABC transporter ATP-binding protein [Gammaproteobacteria bacterium]|tara:strand:+ start:87 stop:812 length:726 start_codon:yes stop_codon:yes gene_type:complete
MESLSAQHLRKSYGSTLVLEDVSLAVNRGEIVGLLGPNGAGKTTCFYMLVGLIKPDSGNINLASLDLTAAPVHERARAGIGYLPQEASVFKTLSTQDNILAILELNDELDKQQRNARLEELIAEFNLGPVRDSLGQSLSGGERRRLEIARALASNPQFILLDEPFAGVDPISVNDIKEEIIDLAKRGIGVLITDHNVKDTLDICDRAYIVHQGRIIAEGQPAEILSNKIVQKVYLGEGFGE